MALREWQGRIDGASRLHSVQLAASGQYARRIVGFSSHGWHSFTRVGTPNRAWGESLAYIVRPEYIDVPLVYVTGITQDSVVKPRNQYRKGTPAKKTYALAESLRASAAAIASKRR